MTNKILFGKSIAEISYLKLKKLSWDDISFQALAKESNYSYKQFMGLVKFIRKNRLAKFSISVNYPILGVFTAFMRVCLKNQGDSERFKQRIRDLDFIQNIYFTGQKKVTFILRIRALSYNQLISFATEIREKTKDIILFTNTSIVYRTHLEEGKVYEKDVLPEKLKLDEKDFEIIYMLQSNAHCSLSSIAKKIGLREPTIHRRIKKLKGEGVIMGYHLVRKWDNIPARYWPVAAFCAANTAVDFDDKKILELPSIKTNKIHFRYLYSAYGMNNLIFSFTTNNMQQFRKFLYDELVNLSGILDVKAYLILEGLNRTLRFYPE